MGARSVAARRRRKVSETVSGWSQEPSSLVKIFPVSCQAAPASFRSRSWRFLCARRTDTFTLSRAIVPAAAVGLRLGLVRVPAVDDDLLGGGDEADVGVGLVPALADGLTAPEAACAHELEDGVEPVLLGCVQEDAELPWGPHHHRTGGLAGLPPAADAFVGPEKRLGALAGGVRLSVNPQRAARLGTRYCWSMHRPNAYMGDPPSGRGARA